ncbi:hypothetical protein ABK995_23160 [Vibrio parahaemolyticus]
MNIYRHNAIIKVFRQDGNPTEQQIIDQAIKHPRLNDFIMNLYQGKPFDISNLVSFDEVNYGYAIWTLTNIYPNEIFYQQILAVQND